MPSSQVEHAFWAGLEAFRKDEFRLGDPAVRCPALDPAAFA